jgi:succinate dehydrogenase/fumarate reductase iron-sulfur protein
MTCYIQSIENPLDQYTIRIRRYNPETDDEPYWTAHTVPFVETMTVMEALEYLWDQGEYIAFRANCREFTCGSCAMLINGTPRLACDTLLENNMTLEPLSRYRVVRDLVVDNQAVINKAKELVYWPEAENPDTSFSVPPDVQEKYSEIYSRCIECYCCLEACPASSSERSRFDGPMHLLHLARAHCHPLDALDRASQASGRGIWACVSCFECAHVCPVELSPATEIAKLRREAITQSLLNLFKARTRKKCKHHH